MQITCFNCRNEVTPKKDRCPHCHADVTGDRLLGTATRFGVFAGIGMGLLITGYVSSMNMAALMWGGIAGALAGLFPGGFVVAKPVADWQSRTYQQRLEAVEERIRRRERVAAA
ncbi:MAG: hypothetical protein EOO38_27985, partial [Cytophagaceae bacterium]